MDKVYWVIGRRLGGRPGPDKAPWKPRLLKQGGIGGIVSLDGPVEGWELELADIQHLPIYQPMILLDTEIVREQFLSVMPVVLDFVDRFGGGHEGVVVHCHHGCDRTGTVLACYLVAREGLTAAQAIERVREANPFAMVAFGYAEAVATFERLVRLNPEPYAPRRDAARQ